MIDLTTCPSTLATGYNDYSPIAIKHLFDGIRVSPFMDYHPIDDDNYAENQTKFTENQKRISISGVQPKYSFVVRDEKLVLSDEHEQGTYILKPKLSSFRNRLYGPANENLTMQIASQVFNIETAKNGLCFFQGDEPAYIVKRFDVKSDGTKWRKEDFATLAGLNRRTAGEDYKYSLSYEECGDLIKKYIPAWRVEIVKFFELVIFNFLICNGDAHLKNFSVLETSSGDFTLAPAYDLLNTKLHADDAIFALPKGLLKNNADEFQPMQMVVGKTFFEFGRRLEIPKKVIRRVLDKYCADYSKLKALIDNSYLSENLKKEYYDLYIERRDSFLKVR